MEIISIKEARIISESDKIHTDGEPVVAAKELELRINPLSLNVLVP